MSKWTRERLRNKLRDVRWAARHGAYDWLIPAMLSTVLVLTVIFQVVS